MFVSLVMSASQTQVSSFKEAAGLTEARVYAGPPDKNAPSRLMMRLAWTAGPALHILKDEGYGACANHRLTF
jgi:hypothetical protein